MKNLNLKHGFALWEVMLAIGTMFIVAALALSGFSSIQQKQFKESVADVRASHPKLTIQENQLLDAYLVCKDAGQPIRLTHSFRSSYSIQSPEQRCAENAILNTFPNPDDRKAPSLDLAKLLHVPLPFSGIQ